MLLLLLYSIFIGRLIQFDPSACALGLKVEVVFCLNYCVNNDIDRLVDDATNYLATHFSV